MSDDTPLSREELDEATRGMAANALICTIPATLYLRLIAAARRDSARGRCRDCKHWGERRERPWAGGLTPPSERRRLEMLDERDCERMGGFASSGGFGKFPHFVDGDHMPRNEAYLMAYDANGKFVTCPDFGCVLWEAAR